MWWLFLFAPPNCQQILLLDYLKLTRSLQRITEDKLPGPASEVHKVFKAAWKLWSRVAQLKFHKHRNKADIVISFNSHDHQDGTPFDGKGGILAHAFPPASDTGGDVHFDADEDWSLNSTGLSLFAVAVHEFGHALGLYHSPDPGAIMYPVYNSPPKNKLQLSYRDVKDIQRLYGASPKYALLKKLPPRTPHKCDQDLSFDAVTELQQEIVFFKGRFMWRKHPQFTETRITLINSLWPDAVPSNLDAVYENVEGNFLVFFKGHQYWKMVQSKVKEGFPRKISDFGFPSRIKSVDAALHFRNERYTVFFTGQECWRYNEQQSRMEGSPVPIEQEWPGIPTPIDAAVFHEGFVHFFKRNLHFQYDFVWKRIISTSSTSDLLECHLETNKESYAEKRKLQDGPKWSFMMKRLCVNKHSYRITTTCEIQNRELMNKLRKW
ncbi:collagenase 3-like isoform X2 [Melanotaenia boesemani]|uniref:collagenase 3-like isoform X2 n=1 Tax=Melanotaenia boesemani TaxID=1250792 RepID=UPI001C04EFEF|nr:collagenase 3-like isoform X2 [Melanotaenia boesemani]